MEEKIKNNEVMSDEELDKISGGNEIECEDDCSFLNALLYGRPERPRRYDRYDLYWKNHNTEIENAWKAAGVDAVVYSGVYFNDGKNIYKVDGKVVTQEQARQHAMNVIGKHFDHRYEWDW
ncbi:MAG: hypothetical protein IKZ58_07375 [Selenomonadaceae bacterium]|nr:hypothetical protein [Selenomonadaceae bacterium]